MNARRYGNCWNEMDRKGESPRSSWRRIDEPVGAALDVGNAIKVAGAGRAEEHRAMAARVGDNLQPFETFAIGECERFVEDDDLPRARAWFGGLAGRSAARSRTVILVTPVTRVPSSSFVFDSGWAMVPPLAATFQGAFATGLTL